MKGSGQMKSAMIIYNPNSGNEEGEEFALKLNDAIRLDYATITLLGTEKAGGAERYANAASRNQFDTVFVLGGDGTVNEVVNGIADQEHRPVIGVIPMGTVNNLSQMLNIPQRPNQAVQAMTDAQVKAIDIGKANDQYFVSTLSTGPIPATAKNVSSDLKSALGPLAYVVEGLQALGSDETTRFELTLDGEKEEDSFSIFLVGMGNAIAGIQTFFPQAQLDDGYLNVMGLGETTSMEKLSIIPELFQQDRYQSEDVVVGRFKEIKLETPDGSIIETTVDGDEGPVSPIDISILPQHLEFFYLPEKK